MIQIIFQTAVMFMLYSPFCSADDNCRLIMDFDLSMQNEMGGYYNRIVKEPSRISVYQDRSSFFGKSGRSLKIVADKREEGWCGIWMHLFNTMDELGKKEVRFYDPVKEGYRYLSFMVRGEKGRENFFIGVADRERMKAEDSVRAGAVSDFLKTGITRQWQEVLIPLEDLGIDLAEFGLINFDFSEMGKQTVYIDSVCFKKKKEKCRLPERTVPRVQRPATDITNAMWVWLAEDILFNDKNQKELLDFCAERSVRELFFQILYEFGKKEKKGRVACRLLHPGAFQKFIANASRKNIRVHALEGYPDWVMRERHEEPLAFCRAVCDYNKSSRPEERFYGIHLDNEPYLMIAYKSPLRARILKEYIELNDKLMRLVRENSSMVFGIDIPFFFDQPDELSGEMTGVPYRGKTKPASEHLLDIVDNVGIMAYRDFAFGADGMIFHSRGEMEYAEKKGKKVFVGIETFKYPLIPVEFIAGTPRKEFYRRLESEARDFAFISRLNGFRIQTFDDGKNVHVGIEVPENMKESPKVRETLLELGRRFGVNEVKKKEKRVDDLLESVEFGISQDVEWQNCEPMESKSLAAKELYRGFRSFLIMLPKITFAEESLADLETEMEAVRKEFILKKSFYGFAIHYYDEYKKLK